MKNGVFETGLLCVFLLAASASAGTWSDDFEDRDVWPEWQVVDEAGSMVEVTDMSEDAGRLNITVEPGMTLYLTAGQFEGDLDFRTKLMIPSLSANGRLGIALRMAPWMDGDPQAYVLLNHVPDGRTEFLAGDGEIEDARKPYTAINNFTFLLVRTETSVIAYIIEDEEEPEQIGEALTIPEGALEAVVLMSAPQGVEPWQVQIEEVEVTGDSVSDDSPLLVSDEEGEAEGIPYEISEAAIHANMGYQNLRSRLWNEAIAEYQAAAQKNKTRYERIAKKVERIAVDAMQGGEGAIRDRKLFPAQEDSITVGEWLQWNK